jgi:formate hydrogenlyase transcriptional activator
MIECYKMDMTQSKESGLSARIVDFKQLLLDVSNRLIAAPFSDLQAEIDNVLAHAGSFLGLDEVSLYEMLPNHGSFVLSRSYLKPGPHGQGFSRDSGFLERGSGNLLLGNAINLKDFVQSTESGHAEESGLAYMNNIGSRIAVPLKVSGSVRGCIVFARAVELGDECLSDIVRVFNSLGEMLASALERMKSTLQIYNHLQFEKLLSDFSATYVSILPSDVEHVIRNDLGRLARFFGTNRCALYIFDNESKTFRTGTPLIWWPDEDNKFFSDLENRPGNQPDRYAHFHYFFDSWRRGEPLQISSLEDLPAEAKGIKSFYERIRVKSVLSIPFSIGNAPVGALVITDTREEHRWPSELIPRIRLCGEILGNALVRKRSEEALDKAFSEIKSLKERLESDYLYLQEEIALERGFNDVVGHSETIEQVLAKARRVAPTKVMVLLLGETGTGKGLIARAIHQLSGPKDRPLIQVNCAALSPHLIESELFGHEKGAFTGATARRQGRFELARGTTLFLDEIGDIPLDLQAKLLRVLQDGEFERVGGNTTLKSDARIIAATNKDIKKEVEAGRFRNDLWYRLSVFPISIPPLRERQEDIPLLVSFLVGKHGRAMGKKFQAVPVSAIRALQQYPWPGNIRELENVIERAVISSAENHLNFEILGEGGIDNETGEFNLDRLEREHILRVLDSTAWIIEGPKGAALRLGLNPGTLRSRMLKLGIRRPGREGSTRPISTIAKR